jgi:predicted MFS family arabinose efflux permease
MLLLAGYTLGGFTGFFVTMSALPAWLAGRGTPEALAGLVTTVLLVATVGTQLLVPRLVQRAGLATALSAGLIALGAPSLLLLVDGGLGWVLGICAVRGVGFGILTVLGAAMTARLVPVARRGEALGIYGLAIAVPNLLAVPGGVALVVGGHFAPVAIIGAAPLLSLVAVPALARSVRDGGSSSDVRRAYTAPADDSASAVGTAPNNDTMPNDDTAPHDNTVQNHDTMPNGDAVSTDETARAEQGRRSRRAAGLAAIGPSLVLLVVTLAGGGFLTYLPIARPDGALATVSLLVWGVAGALTRWRVGVLADRSGLTRLLPGSSATAMVGVGVVAAGLLLPGASGWAVTVLGAALLGIGYGGAQNLTLVAAFARARQRETATVSSVWNVGFDAGTALGAALVGGLTTIMSVPGALAVTGVLVALSIPLAMRSSRPPH